MRKYYIKQILAIAVIALCGCSQNNEANHRMTAKEKAEQHLKDSLALKVGVMQTADCLPAFVAKDEGIFDSLGVDVKLVHFTSMLDYNSALKKNNLQGVFSDSKYIEYMDKTSNLSMQNVRTFDMKWQLVANRRSRLLRLNQFTDKIIAMSRYSVTDFLCDRLTDSVKLDKERVFRVQVNDVDTRLEMLLNNEIDAAWLPEPQATVATNNGNNVLMRSDSRGERFAVLAFTSASLSDKRIKQQIETFEKAYDLASKKIEKGGKKYYTVLVERYFKYKLK